MSVSKSERKFKEKIKQKRKKISFYYYFYLIFEGGKKSNFFCFFARKIITLCFHLFISSSSSDFLHYLKK
jgi:hypothetical protein